MGGFGAVVSCLTIKEKTGNSRTDIQMMIIRGYYERE